MRRKALWVILPLFVAVGLFAFWWGARGAALLSGVKDTVAAELTRTLGTTVTVGEAELTAWNVVTLKNIKVFDKQGRELVNAPVAVIEVNPVRILQNRPMAEAIARVLLNGPELSLYREKSGQWNIDELLTKDLPGSQAFRGKLTLTGGQVFLHEENRLWQIAPVAGSLDFAQSPSIQFRLNLREQDRRARTFGTFTANGQGVLTLQGQNQDLESWQGLFPRDWPLGDLKGRVKQIDITLQKNRDGLKFAGEIRPDGVSGRFAGIDWSEVAGLITFSESAVQFYDVTGKLKGQMLTAAGLILHPMGEPELQMRLQAAGVDPLKLDETLPLRGKVDVEANLSGPWDRLLVDGKLGLPGGEIAGWSVTDFSTRFAGRRFGGNWALRLFEGQGGLVGETLSQLTASLEQTDDGLFLQALSTRVNGGSLAASGRLGPERLDLNLLGAALPLRVLPRFAPELPAAGSLNFTGRLTGSPVAPAVHGDFLALDGQILRQPFTRANGTVDVQGGVISLAKVQVRNGRSLHEVDGTVALAGDRAIALRVKTEGARAEDLAAWLAPGEPLTGNVKNEVTLGGTLDRLEAAGKLTLWEGSYRGFLLSRVCGNYRRKDGILSIDDLEVDSFNAKAVLSGTMDQDQRLNFTVTAHDVETAYLQLKYPYPVEGKVSLNGVLAGTATIPEFQGAVMSRVLRLNGQDLYDVAGQIVLRPDEVEVSSAQFLLGKGQVRANGGYREKTQEIYGGLSVENAELSGLLTILNTPLKNVSGRLEGQVAVTGTLDNPAMQLFGTLHAGRIKNYLLDRIDLNVALRNNVLTIQDFQARQGTGLVIAKGTADLKGPLALEIGGRDIDAGLLAAWLDTKAEIQGKMDFLAQLGGTIAAPKAGLSLNIRDGGVTNATFDELYGLFVLQDEIIQVNQLYITKGEHRASAYGSLPLKAIKRQNGAADKTAGAETMDLRLRLDHANLSILPLLSPEVQWALGETKGEVTIGGTWAHPIYGGNLSITDGALKLKSLADPLEKLGIDIQFEDDKMNVTRFSGTMGGGSFQLTGSAKMNGEEGLAGYEAKLVLDRLGIRHKYFKGPLSGEITLTRQNGNPLLAGKLVFENMTLNVPGIPDTPQSDLDIALALDLVIGKGVRAYSPSLYDIWLGGGLHFGGSLHEPRITGKIELTRGSLEYLGSRFRISEGSIDFPHRRRIDPQIRLEAQANLSQTKVMLNIDGPASEMNLKLSSIPALSPQEIRTVLALRPRSGETILPGAMGSDVLAREEMRSLLTTGFRMQVFGEVENTFREALGLDDFRLVSSTRTTSREPVTFGPTVAAGKPASLHEVYNLEFSKYIGDRVEVSYSMSVNRSEYLASIRYDVTRSFSINASIDEKSSPRWGLEYRIRF
jgi:translocation and assembly module TamB